MFRRLSPLAVALLSISLMGCSVSTVEGPQLKDVPAGFGFDLNASSARRVFRDRELVNQRGYYHREGERHSSIMLSEYAGTTSESEVRAAHEDLSERWGTARYEYNPVDSLTVDGQEAWGWMERQPTSRKYVAVVPYLDATFTVAFYSAERRWQDDEVLRSHVESFARDPGQAGKVLVPLVMVVLIVACLLFAWRLRQQRG